MQTFYAHLVKLTRTLQWMLILLPFLLTGCASVNGISESPLRIGYGVQADPGWQIGNSNSSVHALLGYSRISFKGGGGHNNIWQFGGQFRHSLSKEPARGFWIGGELSYLSIVSKSDGSSIDPKAPAFTIGALAGYRLPVEKLPMSIYFAPAYLNRGKFKINGTSYGEGSSGFYGRLGLSIHLLSLLHDKGR